MTGGENYARYVKLFFPLSSSSPRSRYSLSIKLSIWILMALGSGGNLLRLVVGEKAFERDEGQQRFVVESAGGDVHGIDDGVR